MHAAEKEWPRAAQTYHEAWQYSKTNSVALYLHGHALVQAGRADEGRPILSRAKLLPLADTQERRRLAEALEKRGLKLEATEQWELILRLGAFEGWRSEDWAVREAARQLGNQAAANEQSGRAASLWQQSLFYMLKTSAGMPDLAMYADIVNKIHRHKARDLLGRGKVDEAVREIELARAAHPGDVDLVESTFPQLLKVGRVEVADKLFNDVYQSYEQVCHDFPNAARHHNNVAWLSARCNRRLDDALVHARRAVELRPDRAGYFHTLAEVHIRRGERSEAIAAAKRGLEREPQSAQLKEQLQRFEEESAGQDGK
jgi:tetratricopeptide (TPR) repeat protein